MVCKVREINMVICERNVIILEHNKSKTVNLSLGNKRENGNFIGIDNALNFKSY